MSDTQTPINNNTNNTKQFLDKDGLNALWNKICQTFVSQENQIGPQEIITLDMIDALWSDMIGIGDAIIDETKLNNSKIVE